jgi:hypothetical protein
MQLPAAAPEPFHRLLDHWLALKGARRVPLRAQFDPAEVGYALGNLALVEIEAAPLRVRYRVVGSKLIDLYGGPMTGRYVDELYSPEISDEVHDAYRQLAESAEPLYTRRGFHFFVIAFGYDRLPLPFSRDGGRVDAALLALYPVDDRVKTAADWQVMRDLPPEWVRAD